MFYLFHLFYVRLLPHGVINYDNTPAKKDDRSCSVETHSSETNIFNLNSSMFNNFIRFSPQEKQTEYAFMQKLHCLSDDFTLIPLRTQEVCSRFEHV